MSKGVNQKIKLIRILEMLKSHSDEDNPLATNTIIDKLREQGIECGRKALYEDIKLLNSYGYEIMVSRGQQNFYYVVDRTFDVAELRILLDAVQSAAFITKKKTKELTDKISALAGTHRAELLKKHTVCFDTVKNRNECVYYSVDAIDTAIAQNKKVSFMYFDFGLDCERIYRRDMERYVVNPVGLIFSNGFYYLVCYNDKRQTLTNYRVDRMDRVEVEKDDIVFADCIRRFNKYKEQNLAFSMFSGEEEVVTLYAHNSMTDIIFDKFGHHVLLRKTDDEHFTLKVKVQISPVFLGWCAMFGNNLKVTAPSNVTMQLKEFLESTLSQYQEA